MPNKPNSFRQGKKVTAFGWEAMEGMLKRQIQRIQSGQLARVPGLKESFVHRDSWTRLNVKPAENMQVGSLSLPPRKMSIIILFRAQFLEEIWYV